MKPSPSATRRLAAVFISLALSGMSSPSFSWNGNGHRLVAAIAWEVMTPPARSEATRLLLAHPDVERWDQQRWVGEPDKQRFLACSTWPDEIRNDPRFFTQGEQIPTPLLAGFPEMARHSSWHTEARPLDLSGSNTPPAKSGRLGDALKATIHAQEDRHGTTPHRAYALPWLIHLVGDAHQPLHLSLRQHPDGSWDHLGTATWVEDALSPRKQRKTLHAYWDDIPGTAPLRGTALDQRAQALMVRYPDEAAAQDPGIDGWLDESWRLARTAGYPDTPEEGTKISDVFRTQSQSIGLRRLAEAGFRLGRLLNTLFDHRLPAAQ